MSEKFERVELDQEMEELVSGGKLKWANDGIVGSDRYYVWSLDNPSVKYTLRYDQVIPAKMFAARIDVRNLPDAAQLELLEQNHYVTKVQ